MIKATFTARIIETPKGLSIKPPKIKCHHIDNSSNTLGRIAPAKANLKLDELKDEHGHFILGEIDSPLIMLTTSANYMARFQLSF